MWGHEPIIEARFRGRKPATIYVEMSDYPSGVPSWGIPSETVYVGDSDSLDRLDLVFVKGCFLTISGHDAGRVHRLFRSAREQGAERVLGHVVKPTSSGSFELIEILDTLGILSWHQGAD